MVKNGRMDPIVTGAEGQSLADPATEVPCLSRRYKTKGKCPLTARSSQRNTYKQRPRADATIASTGYIETFGISTEIFSDGNLVFRTALVPNVALAN